MVSFSMTVIPVVGTNGRPPSAMLFRSPPGQALAGWEAIVRLGNATGVKRMWTHAREVFKDMTAAVPAWKDLTWAREARPLALRFAGSRG
jgi:predicted molibdopterin-dependent oxidoreductase YjgC